MKRRTHSADPYVELWVKSNGGLNVPSNDIQVIGGVTMQRYATTIKWNMTFPLWEETFDFTLPCDIINDGDDDGLYIQLIEYSSKFVN